MKIGPKSQGILWWQVSEQPIKLHFNFRVFQMEMQSQVHKFC